MGKTILAVTIILSLSAITAAARGRSEITLCTPTSAVVETTSASTPMKVDSWCYLLQADATKALPPHRYDTVVIDFSRDGTDAGRYTADDIRQIHAKGYRNVLAYLSIGEAESYRSYFNPNWLTAGGRPRRSSPSWLGPLNPNWPGDYKVQYWAEGWQQIILHYLDKITAAGFDGVYLDVVDAFEYWSSQDSGIPLLDEATAANYMMKFIERIAEHARKENPRFYVVIQNAESILQYDVDGEFLRTIDGIGVEDLYYNGRTAESSDWTESRLVYLNRVKAAGKPVMIIDYVFAGTMSDRIVEDFLEQAKEDGFVAYPAWDDRLLNRMTQ